MFCTSARVADVREHSSKILEINKTKTFVILWQMEDLSRLTCLLKGFYSALNFLIDPICLSLIEHIQEGNPGVRQPKSEIPKMGQSILGIPDIGQPKLGIPEMG